MRMTKEQMDAWRREKYSRPRRPQPIDLQIGCVAPLSLMAIVVLAFLRR